MSTGSEAFSLLICLDATKIVLVSIFTLKLIETICEKDWAKSLPKSGKRPPPFNVRRPKSFFASAH